MRKHQISVCGSRELENPNGPYICKYIFNAETEDEYTCFKEFESKYELGRHKEIHKTYSEKKSERYVCGHFIKIDSLTGKNVTCIKEF